MERSDNTGTAKLFKAPSARARGASSAAAEMRKIIGVPLDKIFFGGKIDLSEKIARFIVSDILGIATTREYKLICVLSIHLQAK